MTTREIAACRKSFQHLIVAASLEMFDDKVFTAIRQDIISHFQQQKKIQGASLIVAAFAESLLCERLSSVVRGGAFDFLMRFFFLILVVRVSISNSTCFSSSCRGTMATQRFCNNEKKVSQRACKRGWGFNDKMWSRRCCVDTNFIDDHHHWRLWVVISMLRINISFTQCLAFNIGAEREKVNGKLNRPKYLKF